MPNWDIALKWIKAHNYSNHPQPVHPSTSVVVSLTDNSTPKLPELEKIFENLSDNELFITEEPAILTNEILPVLNATSPSEETSQSKPEAEKSINEDLCWFETLRNNFESLIIDKLDGRTREAFRGNEIVQDEKVKKRLVWPIMKSVTEQLFSKFGGVFPKIHTFEKLSSELGRNFILYYVFS